MASRLKAQKKRRQTKEATAEAARSAAVVVEAELLWEQQSAEHEAQARKEEVLTQILIDLQAAHLSWGDLALFISDPACGKGRECYDRLFQVPGRVEQILTFWVSKQNSTTGCNAVHERIIQYASTISRRMVIDEEFALNFDLMGIYNRLSEFCPIMTLLMCKFSMTTLQEKNLNENTLTKNHKHVGASLVDLLGERSQRNSYAKHVLGLYLYSTGAQRQVLSVLSHMGICSSYPMLAGSGRESDSDSLSLPHSSSMTLPFVQHGVGLLKCLSEACHSSAHERACTGMLGYVYDNINMAFKVAEQILGRKDSQENGTCATVFPLFEATPENMQTSDLVMAYDYAPPLSFDDIDLFWEEGQILHERLRHTVLRIIIPLHKTDIYHLPAMNIDESKITGNAEVMEMVFEELGMDMDADHFRDTVKLIFGDQLSIAHLRSLINNRAGHDSFNHSYLFAAFGLGFFHHQMAATHGVLEMHWGGPVDPGSLCFHNTRLDRKPIILTSLPPYHTCRDLIFVSLYAWVLHCLELVAKAENLEEYLKDLTFIQLQEHADQIAKTFVSPASVSKLQTARAREQRTSSFADATHPPPLTQGDMVLENGILFMQDALILREFMDAIKAGDSGRIITILKVYALGYCGSGQTKYAHELLFLVHNLTHVWLEPLRKIVLNNWLHINFWVKTIYKAQGSNASWEWLAMIAPCIDILRRLVTQINGSLGSKQGNKHQSLDLMNDIAELKRALRKRQVYILHPGRVIDGDKAKVPNVIASGLAQLNGLLHDYNKMIQRLKERRKMQSLVGIDASFPEPTTADVESDSDDNDDEGDDTLWQDVDELEPVADELLSLETEDDVALDMD
ncbi:hypothetical protein BKA93DRAFT_819674 [Sparassis latifolia]